MVSAPGCGSGYESSILSSRPRNTPHLNVRIFSFPRLSIYSSNLNTLPFANKPSNIALNESAVP